MRNMRELDGDSLALVALIRIELAKLGHLLGWASDRSIVSAAVTLFLRRRGA